MAEEVEPSEAQGQSQDDAEVAALQDLAADQAALPDEARAAQQEALRSGAEVPAPPCDDDTP